MHPDHDHLLQNLISRAARSDQIPADLSIIDAGREVRGLLARIAAESNQADWSPDVTAMIGRWHGTVPCPWRGMLSARDHCTARISQAGLYLSAS